MCNRWDKRKKITFWVSLSLSAALLLVTLILVLWFVLLSDKNRSTHVRSDATYTEIIKKNYIKGFENTASNGEFTFRLREDEINDFLYDGAQNLNDKYISTIYYEKGENKNSHIFYVDLKNTFYKTRVVIFTTARVDINNPYLINLDIDLVKMGKINALRICKSKGYLTSEFVNKYFEECHLPISFNEKNLCFVARVDELISVVEKGTITNMLWDQTKLLKDTYSVNPSTLGFKTDFSRLRINCVPSNTSTLKETPNFYAELLNATNNTNVGALPLNEEIEIYNIGEEEINTLFTECLPTNKKEEVTSKLISSRATVDFVGTSTSFKDEDTIGASLILSINGYPVDVNLNLTFEPLDDIHFNTTIFIEYETEIAGFTYKENSNKYVSNFTSCFEELCKNIREKQGNFLSYNKNQGSLSIYLENLDENTSNAEFKDTWKLLRLNPVSKTIDFKIVKYL